MKAAFVVWGVSVLVACAAGPHDALDGTSHDVRGDASVTQPTGYAYVARRSLVAIGLADVHGVSDDEAHGVIDRVANEATACFKRSANLTTGAVRIVLPIDEGGIAGAPQTEFSPPSAAVQGMLCILAPLRMSTFAPAANARSIKIEAAWGNDLTQ